MRERLLTFPPKLGAKAAITVLAPFLLFFASGLAPAQTAVVPAQISFQFERQGLPVSKFTLTVDEAGSTHYEAEEIVGGQAATSSESPLNQHLERMVKLSKPTTDRLFATAKELDHFSFACASKMKNIADTGTKTLRYMGPDGEGSCTYNYSQDKRVASLTDLFLGVARSLDVGRRLDFQHRFDRLGLDATMASLVEEVESGRAVEVGVISPTLRSLAEDPAILKRVRERAARLLQTAQSPS